jgi:hypothetical protein
VLVKEAQRDLCFCMIEQVLSFLYYISPLVSHWREKGASVPVLENDLFSDVAAASCNLWQPLVGCNIISYLMQTWVLLQYHVL